jgi:hypothetical protein
VKGVNPKLQQLLDTDELDWDNSAHREAYLRAWLNEPREDHEEPDDEG